MKFTVITVALNTEKVIERTILSVLNQTILPYEYIIIDGDSADKTVEICEEFSPLFAQKGIKYTIVSEKDTGVFDAYNKGIRLATGDFISFLNAGDWYESDALERVEKFYKDEPFDLAYGGIHYIFPDGKVINKMSKLDHFPVSSRNWNHPSMFLRTGIYKKYKFREDYKMCGDFDLYLKLRKDGTKIRVINEVITNYPADGLSTNPSIRLALRRAYEKYRSYRENGYGRVYWLEAYGWEVVKNIILRIQRKRGN